MSRNEKPMGIIVKNKKKSKWGHSTHFSSILETRYLPMACKVAYSLQQLSYFMRQTFSMVYQLNQ